MCDPRGDSDALYHQFGGVHLRGVDDLQLMDVAVRRRSGDRAPYCHGLGKIIPMYLPTAVDLAEQALRRLTVSRFTQDGGDPTLWIVRPLDPDLLRYARGDIGNLLPLHRTLLLALDGASAPKMATVRRESQKRADCCLLPQPLPSGKERAIAPRSL